MICPVNPVTRERALQKRQQRRKGNKKPVFLVTNITKEFISKVSFPLVGNPSEERLRTSRSDKLGSHTYVLISKCSVY
mgnify:CR=1 FL=1